MIENTRGCPLLNLGALAFKALFQLPPCPSVPTRALLPPPVSSHQFFPFRQPLPLLSRFDLRVRNGTSQ